MRILKTLVLALGGVAACSACVSTGLREGAVARAPAEPERIYQAAKVYLAQHSEAQAEQAFKQAIALAPAHAEAHNGLGILYFGQGRFEMAESQFKQAIAAAPQRAHLHGNLGFVYLVTGRVEAALATLEHARALDPYNERVQTHLAEAHAKAAQRAPLVAAAAPAPAPRPDTLREVAPNVWEMPAAATSAPAPSSAHLTALPVARGLDAAGRIEVSNGVGVNGLARRVGSYLAGQGYAPARVTNQPPFDQARTELHYVAGNKALALKVSRLFAQRPHLVAAPSLERQMQLRLVLGRGFNVAQALAQRDPAGAGEHMAPYGAAP
ncbi:MAG: tetratricopeptide repeat protein [Pseudomonadota bacterium]